MTVVVFAIIILSSLSWALLDFSRKKLVEKMEPVPVVVWLMVFQTPVFLALAAQEAWVWPEAGYWWPAFGSILLNCLANVCFVEGLKLAPLSLAVPMLSLTPVFTSLGAFTVLEEPTTPRQAIGIAIIVASAFWLGRSGAPSEGHGLDPHRVRKGMWLTALVALLWATTPVLDKVCLKGLPSSEHAFLQCLGIVVFLWGWLKVKGSTLPFRPLKHSIGWFGFAVVVAALALFTQFRAIQYVPVGVFEALKRSVGLLSALTLGFFFFKEPITRVKVAMVVVMGVGIFILLA